MPIADGSEEMEAVIIIDVLRRAKAKVVVASIGGKQEILASRKVKLVADTHLDEAAKSSYDLIVLPVSSARTFELIFSLSPSPQQEKNKQTNQEILFRSAKNIKWSTCWQGGLGGAQEFAASEKLIEMLKKQRESNKPYGAICASPALVFEPHGLLKVII